MAERSTVHITLNGGDAYVIVLTDWAPADFVAWMEGEGGDEVELFDVQSQFPGEPMPVALRGSNVGKAEYMVMAAEAHALRQTGGPDA